MRTTFSRWPAHELGVDRQRELDSAVRAPSKAIGLAAKASCRASAGLIILVPSIATGAAGWAVASGSPSAIPYISTAALLCLAGTLEMARRIQIQARATKLADLAFRNAGISMWREDWSAAAQAVADLRQQGVLDIEGYYAQRPEELRHLRSKVFIKDVNDFAVQEMGGRSKAELIGSLDKLLPDTDQTFVQWLVAFAREDRLFRSEAHITNPDGSIRHSLFTAAIPTDLSRFNDLIVISMDITEFRLSQELLLEAEAKMARAARMTTVGALTASIAHEVNGPLGAVMANAEAALRFMDAPDVQMVEVREALVDLVADATRAAQIVRRTRAFISKTVPEKGPVDVVECLRQANLLLDRELRDLGATVHVNAVDVSPLAYADAISIQQIFVNLLLNAAQAMKASPAPRDVRVDVQTRGDFVHIDVVDRGPGIAREDMARIFDPFFTTKSGGMGMGLAIALSSAEGLGGELTVSNAVGGGAAFHLQLPVLAA